MRFYELIWVFANIKGDSGGALIQRDASGRATLVGVVSVGNGCGRRGYPGIYTKASFYIDWIQKTIST
jgi:secreted trypsin-like serine protease